MLEKRKIKLIFALFIVSLFILIFSIYLKSFVTVEIKEIPATLNVGNTSAFDTNNSFLSFGTISKGVFSQRNIVLTNNYDFPIICYIGFEGNITNFLVKPEQSYLKSGESKTISISTITLEEEGWEGFYSGKVIVTIKKVI